MVRPGESLTTTVRVVERLGPAWYMSGTTSSRDEGRQGTADPIRTLRERGDEARRKHAVSWLALEGKTILVCGVANKKSVGFQVGERLHKEGATVVWTVHTEARRAELAERLAGDVYVCDVSQEAEIEALRERLGAQHARIDGLVHSIAFADYSDGWKPFHETRRRTSFRPSTSSAFRSCRFPMPCANSWRRTPRS